MVRPTWLFTSFIGSLLLLVTTFLLCILSIPLGLEGSAPVTESFLVPLVQQLQAITFGVDWFLVVLIIFGTVLKVWSLVLRPGFKRAPFWTGLGLGVALEVIGLGLVTWRSLGIQQMVPLLSGSEGSFPLFQPLVVFAGWLLLEVAGFVQSKLVLPAKPWITVMVVVALGSLVLPGLLVPELTREFQPVDMASGVRTLQQIVRSINPQLREQALEELQRIQEDQNLTPAQKNQRIQELVALVQEMEADMERFRRSQERNLELEQEIARLTEELNRTLEELDNQSANPLTLGFCQEVLVDGESSSVMVNSIAQGVRPTVPCVRDFALSIASAFPGPFGDSRLIPTTYGIQQVVAPQGGQ